MAQFSFENYSFAFARDVTRRHMMEVTQLRHRSRKLEHVARAAHVNAHRQFAFNRKIVHCCKMKDARRLCARAFRIRGRECETSLADVARDDLKIVNRFAAQLRDTRDLVSSASGE